jgi:hypothetical protein
MTNDRAVRNLSVNDHAWWQLYLYGSIEAYEMNWHGSCKDVLGTYHIEFEVEREVRARL